MITDNIAHDDRIEPGRAVVALSLHTIFVTPIIQNHEIRAFVYIDNHLRNGIWSEEKRALCKRLIQYMSRKIEF